VGRYYLSRIPSIDDFRIRDTANGGQELCFRNLAVETGLESAENFRYEYQLKLNGQTVLNYRALERQTCIRLTEWESFKNAAEGQQSANSQWEVKIRLQRGEGEKWSQWVSVFLAREADSGKYLVLGVER